jgi:hypothetical protein
MHSGHRRLPGRATPVSTTEDDSRLHPAEIITKPSILGKNRSDKNLTSITEDLP